MDENMIIIDGEEYFVFSVNNRGFLPMVHTENGEFYVSEDWEMSQEAMKRYWVEMAENDPKEFICLAGEETVISWGLGYGTMEDWIEQGEPETLFSTDYTELDVEETSEDVIEDIGFVPTIAYRS